ERDALLVGVQEEKEPRVLAPLVRQRGAPRLAAGRLDLDDLGAQPREHLRAGGAGFVLGEIEDADSVEGLGHVGSPLVETLANSRTSLPWIVFDDFADVMIASLTRVFDALWRGAFYERSRNYAWYCLRCPDRHRDRRRPAGERDGHAAAG